VELGPVSTLPFSSVEPSFALGSLPFLFESIDKAIEFYKRDIAGELLGKLETKNIKALALWLPERYKRPAIGWYS
jgi:TRAP-type C4-dicarboxylate transport system substrate-binding protein